MTFGKNYQVDPKIPFPRSLDEAINIITATFEDNSWNDRDINVYLKSLRIETDFKDLSRPELHTVLNDLIASKMILFKV